MGRFNHYRGIMVPGHYSVRLVGRGVGGVGGIPN